MRKPPSTVTRRFSQDKRSHGNRSIPRALQYLRKKIRTPDLSRGWYHRSDLATLVPHGFTRLSQLHEDTGINGDAQLHAGSPQSREQNYSTHAAISPQKIRIPDLSRGWYHRSDLTTQVPHGLTWSSLLHEDTAVDGDAQVHAGLPQSHEQKYSMRAAISPQKNKDAGFVEGLVSP